MRAAIAIGSNSTRLLCAEKRQGRLADLLRARENTRLFLGLDDNGNLLPERIADTARAVRDLYRQALDHGAESTALFATSAVRDAKNGAALAERIHALCGLRMRVISGEEEARLAFAAAAGAERRLVLDIGGGSTEFTVGEAGWAEWAGSAQMGASRLLKMCPISCAGDAERALGTARETLSPFAAQVNALKKAVGITGLGGSCTTAAAMLLGREAHGEEIEGWIVTLQDARAQLQLLSSLTVEERMRVPGLPAARAEHMPHGLCILISALELTGFDRLKVSVRTNLDGYLLSLPDEA